MNIAGNDTALVQAVGRKRGKNMDYRLLATDLDGTLLNSKKEISMGNINAINHALDSGKHVVFSTGRALGEVTHLMSLVPKMRYILCESGALIYDWERQKILEQHTIQPDTARTILEYAAPKDIFIQIMIEGQTLLPKDCIGRLEHYHNEYLGEHFKQTAVFVDSPVDVCRERGWVAEKICLYHPTPELREQSRRELAGMGLDCVMAFSEITSLEITPLGIDKGNALRGLCELLGIGIEQTIAVGDSPNDTASLLTAGLPVAVKNASEDIIAICREVVADNESDGVKEAIERFLL